VILILHPEVGEVAETLVSFKKLLLISSIQSIFSLVNHIRQGNDVLIEI
jgi:hypothetical protein